VITGPWSDAVVRWVVDQSLGKTNVARVYPTGNTFHRPNLGDRRLTERPARSFSAIRFFRFSHFYFPTLFP
jgi:hypothetical protein